QQRAMEIYQDRFSDASDFTFVIVGSFDEEEIQPYLEQYLAGLPATGREEAARDLGIQEPKEAFEKVVHKGKESKAAVRLNIFGDYQYSREENANVSALETILTTKLIERLREDERSEEHTSELQSRENLVCRLL